MTHHFFGYGSLVNRATHSYTNAQPAEIKGWRRAWVHTPVRPLAYLSVVRDPTCTILGLVAEVPGGDWSALDAREYGYIRQADHAHTPAPQPQTTLPIQIYTVPPHANAPATPHPLLLSYLDAVIQGFIREYGAKGAAHFFATTTNWHTPIINDRTAPQYPRAQALTKAELAMVDEGLAGVGAVWG
jgi:hypothetical protein